MELKDNFKSRLIYPLPNKRTSIEVYMEYEDKYYFCDWNPYDEKKYDKGYKPGEGYLGTARITKGKLKGIGFHAWHQNNSEFIYYRILDNV